MKKPSLEELKSLAREAHDEMIANGGMFTASYCVCGSHAGGPTGTPLCALLADYLDRRYPRFAGRYRV